MKLIGSDWIKLDLINWIKLDFIGSNRIKLNQIGPNGILLDQIGSKFYLLHHFSSKHRREKAPHRSTRFCDPETTWPTNKGSDNRFCLRSRQLQKLRDCPCDRFQCQVDVSNCWKKKSKKMVKIKQKIHRFSSIFLKYGFKSVHY